MTISRNIAAAIAIGTLIGSLAPADAGLLGDVVKAVGSKVADKVQSNNRPAQAQPQQQKPQQQAQAPKSQYEWLGNKPYVECIKNAELFSGWNGATKSFTGAEKAKRYDQGRRECNMKYYGHQ